MKLKILLFALLLLAACREITMEGPTMAFEFRSQLGNVLLSGNPIWVDVGGASIPAGATDYKILLKITSDDGALIGSPIIDAIAPVNGEASFDIQGRVDQAVDYDFEYPQINKLKAYDLLAFDITLEIGERYVDSNGDPQETWSGITESHRVLSGGLSRKITQDIAPSDFYDNFINAGKFLTWQPNNQKISPDQPVKLWYVLPGQGQTPPTILHYNVHYPAWIVEKGFAVSMADGNLYELNLSPELWEVEIIFDMASVGGEGLVNAAYIEVYFTIGDDVDASEKRRFYFNTNYYEENTFIHFKNSIGGVDCLWCTGKVTELTPTERKIASRPDKSGTTNHKRATQVVTSVTGQRKWEINKRFDTKEELLAFRDFVYSDQMWLIEDSYIIPVYLEDKEQILAQISRNLDDISFTLLEAHIESNY